MNANPYAPPNAPCDPFGDCVDRRQRDALAASIRRFLGEKATAFELDESLDEFRDSRDGAVRFVAEQIWLFYDDCDDHPVAMNKPAWDYVQRLLLLLESNRSVETTRSRRWSATQLVALAALVALVATVWQFGWPGYAWFVLAIPFGVVSIAISRLRRSDASANPYEPLVYPFATLGDLKTAYDAVGFRKARCPRQVRDRRIRPAYLGRYYLLQFYAAWTIVSPAVLIAQSLPRIESRVRVTG